MVETSMRSDKVADRGYIVFSSSTVRLANGCDGGTVRAWDGGRRIGKWPRSAHPILDVLLMSTCWGPASVLVSWGTLGPGRAIRRPPTPHITPAASSGSTFGDSSSLVWTVEERRKFRIHTLIVVKASNHWLNVILAGKFDPIYVPILQLRKLRLRHENKLTELGFEPRKPNP